MKNPTSDAGKTKQQLLEELALLRDRVAELESAAGMSSGVGRNGFYEKILETVKDGLWVTNTQDVIIYVNNGVAGIAGIPKSKIIGMNVLKDFPEKTIKNFQPFYQLARKTLQPLQYAALVVTPSNRETWQAGWLLPLAHKVRFHGMICTVQDVTIHQETQDQYRTILKTTRDGFITLDMQGRILDVNDAYCAITGYSRGELLRMRIEDVEAIETPREIKDRISSIKKNGTALFETLQRRKDGSIIDVEVSVSYLGIGEGRIINLTRNITARKRMENALRQSEATARTLLNIPSTAMMLLDTKANFIDVNDTMTRRFCRPREAMQGMCMWDILPPHVAKLRKKYFSQTLSSAEMVRWEDERQGMWNDNAFIPIIDERGKIVQIIGFAVDITASKQTAERLRESEERYRMLVEGIPEAIITANSMGKIVSWNKGAEKIYGYAGSEIIGKDFVIIMPERVRETHDRFIKSGHWQSPHTEKGKPVQGWGKKKDGREFPTEQTSSSYMTGEQVLFTTAVRDISDRKKTEELLQESEKRHRTIFEACGEGILVAEIQSLRFQYANPAICAMLGYSLEELQRRGLTDIHPKKEFEHVKRNFSGLAQGLQSTVHDIPCRRKDGSILYADIAGTKLLFDGKDCVLGFFTDTTERKAIERKLLESETLFRQTFEHAPIGIVIIDKKGATTNVNSFFADMLNYSADTLKTRGIDTCLHAEDKQKSIKTLVSAPLKLRKSAAFEKRYVASDGHTVYVKEYIRGIFNKADELIFVIVLIDDMTSHTHVETLNINIITKLKSVYKELREFAEMLPDDKKFSSISSIHDYKLSPMENKVASLIYHGYTNNKIASKFALSESTVKHHITRIFSKFRVGNRLEFVNTIRERRIIM